MKIGGSMLALALVAGLAACSNNTQNPPAQSAQTSYTSTAGAGCAQPKDVHATVADTNNGVAITFTGPQNELDQLREAVHAMADANEHRGDAFAGCPCAFSQAGPSATMISPGDGAYSAATGRGEREYGATLMQPGSSGTYATSIPADSHVDEIATGAVLKLDAKDMTQLQALRDDVRAKVHAMRDNGCLTKR